MRRALDLDLQFRQRKCHYLHDCLAGLGSAPVSFLPGTVDGFDVGIEFFHASHVDGLIYYIAHVCTKLPQYILHI
mgnify:CR=1 FL=1